MPCRIPRTAAPLAVAALAALSGALPSCAARNMLDGERSLDPGDFVSDGGARAAAPSAAASPSTRPAVAPGPGPGGAIAGPLVLVDTRVGAPELAPDAAPVPGAEAVLVEAKVGDINGRPVYAGEFFAPISARLVAERDRFRQTPEQFRQAARTAVRERLEALRNDELLRAEALSRLTEEQKAGLRYLLEKRRQDIVSENRGSQQAAEQALIEREGVGLEEFLRRQREEALVGYGLQEEIDKRVNVSWRDITQRYRADSARIWNPPPTAKFRVVRVFNDAAAEQVSSRLAAGESFVEIAESDLNTVTDPGGAMTQNFEGEFNQGEFFPLQALNEAARSLEEGEHAGPIEAAGGRWWVMLESLENRSVPLYDAQLEIQRQIELERRQRVLARYVSGLMRDANQETLKAMEDRLVEIAVERYGPARNAAAGAGAGATR